MDGCSWLERTGRPWTSEPSSGVRRACLGLALAGTREEAEDRASWFFTGFLKVVIRRSEQAGLPAVLVDQSVTNAFRNAEQLGHTSAGRWLRHFSEPCGVPSAADTQELLPQFLEWLEICGLSSTMPHMRIISCLILAGMYWEGKLVPKDNDTAATWWYITTELDFRFSYEALVSLVGRLTFDEEFTHSACCDTFVPWITEVASVSKLTDCFQHLSSPMWTAPSTRLTASAWRGVSRGSRSGTAYRQLPMSSLGRGVISQSRSPGSLAGHRESVTPPARDQPSQSRDQWHVTRSYLAPSTRHLPRDQVAGVTSSGRQSGASPNSNSQHGAPSATSGAVGHIFWGMKKPRTARLPCGVWRTAATRPLSPASRAGGAGTSSILAVAAARQQLLQTKAGNGNVSIGQMTSRGQAAQQCVQSDRPGSGTVSASWQRQHLTSGWEPHEELGDQ